MDFGKVALAIVAVGSIFGFIYFISRPKQSSEVRALPPGRETRQYTNTETWDIEWDKDGLPKTVTITRKAIES